MPSSVAFLISRSSAALHKMADRGSFGVQQGGRRSRGERLAMAQLTALPLDSLV